MPSPAESVVVAYFHAMRKARKEARRDPAVEMVRAALIARVERDMRAAALEAEAERSLWEGQW